MLNAGATQPELFRLDDIEGYGTLTRKERVFVEEIFAGKTQREAAKAAGITGEENYIDVAACRLMRTDKVQRVLCQAWRRSGADIDETLRQAAEIARRALNEWRNGATAEQREAARKEWKDAASLLASIHSKLHVQIEGTLNHNHKHELQVPAYALPILAQLRRESIAVTPLDVETPRIAN